MVLFTPRMYFRRAHRKSRTCRPPKCCGKKVMLLPLMLPRWYIAGGRILAGTSGVALCAALSLPLKAVGTSLPKNTARIAARRWTEVAAMRLIDADAVKFRVEYGYDNNGVLLVPYRDIKKSIEAAKTVDAVPVVRCKECENSYYAVDDLICSYGPCVDCPVPPDFWCANGRRREDSHAQD
nr:MAG TPA: hypothetical protein [Caudoviricetes sp.]